MKIHKYLFIVLFILVGNLSCKNGSLSGSATPQGSKGFLSLFAGNAEGCGSADGKGTQAAFFNPINITIDNTTGIFYVTDSFNANIRKITPDGTVSTLAGKAVYNGSTDGIGQNALFTRPNGIAVDSNYNLYVSDSSLHTIRMITKDGVVTTIAGQSGTSGFSNGTGTAATFKAPAGIAIDISGNLYVADTGNNAIRKITPSGSVSTIAGTFFSPVGIAIDNNYSLYITENGTNKNNVRVFTTADRSTWTLSLTVGAGTSGSADGTTTGASFKAPSAIALDAAKNMYVADTGNNKIRKITPAGVVTSITTSTISGYANGDSASTQFNSPKGITVDSLGNLYVVDSGNSSIRKISTNLVSTTFAGSALVSGSTDATGTDSRFSVPAGLTKDSKGNLYLADTGNFTIRMITSEGIVTTLAGAAGQIGIADGIGAAARFTSLQALSLNKSETALYLTDSSTIRKIILATGQVSTIAGIAGSAGATDGAALSAKFNNPQGLIVDSSENIYIADTNNHTIRMLTAAGNVSTLAGIALSEGSTDGTNTNALFNFPTDLVLDSTEKNLYITDRQNYTIRKIDLTTNAVTTFAGKAGHPDSTDGTGTSARFYIPGHLSIDNSNNLFVVDTGNLTVRIITPAGVVSTLAGTAHQGIFKAGELPGFISVPSGISVANNGNVLFVTSNNSIIKIQR